MIRIIQKKILMLTITGGLTLLLACISLADVPAPPTNQFLGIPDVAFSSLSEADCRACHEIIDPIDNVSLHHAFYSLNIPDDSVVPNPDANGDGNPEETYGCLNCHEGDPDADPPTFFVERDCLVCHTTSLHHNTVLAQNGDCVACHGDLVDKSDDGHYIPIYQQSLVTTRVLESTNVQPLNNRGKGAGACNYCHDVGLDTTYNLEILTNEDLHHIESFISNDTTCTWCHSANLGVNSIRGCEGCHGPESLHNIQADSPNANNIGTIVVGGEDVGYGHVGRDAGPGDSDCWGCHGFSTDPLPDLGDYPDAHPSFYDGSPTEADCRVCHDSGIPDRHHVLYGTDLPSLTNAPFWSPGDVIYVCLSCHDNSFTVVRDCLVCHMEDIDSDGDGLTDGKERSIGTDPSDSDSDDDGLTDGEEIDKGTDPLNSDSDGDLVIDGNDICPLEDANGFDANQDGCIDTASGLSDVVDTLVDEGVIDTNLADSLSRQVNNANVSADKENICAAINQLEAFKNQVNAQRGKKISHEAANELIAYVDNVIAGFLSQLPTGESC